MFVCALDVANVHGNQYSDTIPRIWTLKYAATQSIVRHLLQFSRKVHDVGSNPYGEVAKSERFLHEADEEPNHLEAAK